MDDYCRKSPSLLSIRVLLSKQTSQRFATFCSQSGCFIFILFNAFCVRYCWLILIFIMRLFSARYFKFMIKSRDFVRIFWSSFLLETLRKTLLEIAVKLAPGLFWAYFFLQMSTFYMSLESIFHTDSTLQKTYTLKM